MQSYHPSPSPPSTTPLPSLTASLPTLQLLQSALPSIQIPSFDPSQKIIWARDVLFLVDKQSATSSTDTPIGPAIIHDPALFRLVQIALPIVLAIAASATPGQIQGYVAEALFLRATFEASGAYPDYIPHNPRSAFRDFEAAARGGYAAAWFRLGRDYENFNDVTHARDCFERGVKLGVESCAYVRPSPPPPLYLTLTLTHTQQRMGMAHLMGQLGLPSNPVAALPLLHRAALLSTPQVPQPAYVYALLLLSEFTQLPSPLPSHLFTPYIPSSSTPSLEARKHLERAAFLGFAPAQYKLGHAYEFATPPFPFDPLLSVQYYSLASQQGEVEADMALSKWFLCGSGTVESGGGFEKDEHLAWTFASKAAKRGLPSAEFAMGYYAEVGVGGPRDVGAAMRWYALARDHGNGDAEERMKALTSEVPQVLSRSEHDAITENKLVRKRTMAKERSDRSRPEHSQGQGQGQGQFVLQNPHAVPEQQRPPRRQVLEIVRKSSMMIPGAYPSQAPAPAPHLPHSHSQPHPYTNPNANPSYPHHNNSTPPIPASTPPIPVSAPPRPHSQPAQMHPYSQAQARPLSGAKRYTLTDAQPNPTQPTQPIPNLGLGRKSPGPGSAGGAGRKSPGPGAGMAGPGGRGRGRASLAGSNSSITTPPIGGAAPWFPAPMPGTMVGNSPTGTGMGGGAGDEREREREEEVEPGVGVGVGLGGGVVYSAKPSKGPTTFAEMGFQGAKAEDKECVVM